MAVLTKADLLEGPTCDAAAAAIQKQLAGPWANLGLGWCAVASPSVELPQKLQRWQADRLEGAAFIGELAWGALDCSRLGMGSLRSALSRAIASAQAQQQQQQQQAAGDQEQGAQQVSGILAIILPFLTCMAGK
jgi:hypothetical protein